MKNILFILILTPLVGCSTQNTATTFSTSKTLSAFHKPDPLEATYHIEVLKTEQKRRDDPVFKIAKEKKTPPASSFYALKLSLKF